MPKRVAYRASRPRRRTFIAEWRDYRNLTQDALANRLDMSAAQLSRIESGKQPYTQDTLEAIADALRTDPASLLMRNPKAEGKDEPMWSIWDQAKPGIRRQLTEIARALVRTGTE